VTLEECLEALSVLTEKQGRSQAAPLAAGVSPGRIRCIFNHHNKPILSSGGFINPVIVPRHLPLAEDNFSWAGRHCNPHPGQKASWDTDGNTAA